MIKLDFSLAVFLYLATSVITILAAWIYFEQRRYIKRRDLTKDLLRKCDVCTYVYVDSHRENFSTCPQCGSYNVVNMS